MFAFTLWDSLWVVFTTFLFVGVLIALFAVVGDVLRDDDLTGVAKAAWMIGLLLFPVVGLLVYLVVRGHGMTERSTQYERAAKASIDQYIRQVSGGAASELATAKALLDSGVINDTEFAALKTKTLA